MSIPNFDSHPDASLVESARGGDTEAFAELWRRHASAGRTVASGYSSFDPDDVVAESFTRIFHVIREGGGPTGAFRPYLFIKNYRERGPQFVFPDRDRITMTAPFMRAYTDLLVATCHKRGAHAIGGMSAFIPDRRTPAVTARALERVREDKMREAGDGFDGTWVAHPGLIETARAEFDAVLLGRPHQLDRLRPEVTVAAEDLLDVRSLEAHVTEAGVRANVAVALRYIESWLRGIGAVALDSLMEDTATAELSRSQLWQWIHNQTVTIEGTVITRSLVEAFLEEEVLSAERTPADCFDDAATIVRLVSLGQEYPTFLTIATYARFLIEPRASGRRAA
jgi:malate synthase